MKSLPKILLAAYVLVLLWLVLFKFSYDLPSVLFDHQTRSLSLIPFAELSRGTVREMIDNLVVFIPFGLLLGVNLKQTTLWNKLTLIFTISLAAEVMQYVLAIGTTDITDLITNTLGGLFGLAIYDVAKKHVDNTKLDRIIVAIGIIVLVIFLVLRIFVLRVRY